MIHVHVEVEKNTKNVVEKINSEKTLQISFFGIGLLYRNVRPERTTFS